MKVSRHLSRECALQTIFAWLFWSKAEPVEHYFELLRVTYFPYEKEDLAFCTLILEGVSKHFDTIVKTVEQFAPEWPFDKIAMVDRSVLCIGIFEILYNDDVPDIVAINESIELAKKFGNESSPKFVNGVLNALMKSRQS